MVKMARIMGCYLVQLHPNDDDLTANGGPGCSQEPWQQVKVHRAL